MIPLQVTVTNAVQSDAWQILGDAFPVVLGATIGFGVSWFFAWKAERDRRLSEAYELFFEAQKATETISELRRVLTQNLDKVGIGYYQYHWQAVQLPAGFDWSARCEISSAALAILASAKKFELINEIMELSKLHDLALIITNEYSRRQESLTEKLRAEGETKVNGTVISMYLSEATIARHAPDVMRVEDLLRQLLSKVTDGTGFAQELTKRLGPELRDALKDKRFRGRIEYVPKTESKSGEAVENQA